MRSNAASAPLLSEAVFFFAETEILRFAETALLRVCGGRTSAEADRAGETALPRQAGDLLSSLGLKKSAFPRRMGTEMAGLGLAG
jgi:hypothetical protein